MSPINGVLGNTSNNNPTITILLYTTRASIFSKRHTFDRVSSYILNLELF